MTLIAHLWIEKKYVGLFSVAKDLIQVQSMLSLFTAKLFQFRNLFPLSKMLRICMDTGGFCVMFQV